MKAAITSNPPNLHLKLIDLNNKKAPYRKRLRINAYAVINGCPFNYV